MKTHSKSSLDVYQIVTDRIITKLTEGVIPWKQPWQSAALPTNYLTGKPYRGINLLLLGMSGYSHHYFLTYKQAQQLGGHVRKGAKSELVIFWQMRYYDERKNKWVNLNRGNTQPSGVTPLPFLKYYRVFNVQDVEGIDVDLAKPQTINDDLLLDDLELGYQPLRRLEGLQLVTHYPIACYHPKKDTICMPTITNFRTTSGYFQVLYHELTHATGHAKRLNRVGITDPVEFNSERYSKEELIAELGSCFLMSKKGFTLEDNLDNSASYLHGWLDKLRGDKKLLVEAATQAQKAVDYILNDQ